MRTRNLKKLAAHRKLDRGFFVVISGTTGRAFAAYLRRKLLEARKHIEAPLHHLEVILVGDRFMSQLHARFMDNASPTDVLTFPLEENLSGSRSGEVYVNVAEARRRAREQKGSVRDELLLYAIHGMLHLSGMDDRNARGFKAMHRMEDEILTRLGVGPVFHPDEKTCRLKPARRRAGFSPRVLPKGNH